MVSVNIEIDTDDIIGRKADSKGRVTIGAEYADKNVKVAVLEIDEEEE